ncbi:MAG TPA: LLM class flavin-dependent oxidoreductase [Acidimicrobiales bacterium]|nr:LLM class flavin-dependent oxidoreductase [Acidimicrobiales bacterium]
MEFGIIVQSPVFPWDRKTDPDAEHNSLMRDLEYVQACDRAGFKYCWATEHHFLDEYSHLSANDVFLGYLAHATERIHLGSGIFNPLPQVNHPAKVAEKIAMLDHLSGGRFEFGSGRGAGTHEILGFLPEMRDLNHTREIWEDVIREFAKMWTQDTYEGYQGKYWSLPPRKVLPKPFVKPHPAMWYAAGNASSWEMAARRGLGVLGFSVNTLQDLSAVIDSYKNNIDKAEPVGAFVNDNIMVCALGAALSEETARAVAPRTAIPAYFTSLLYRYHDTFPRPEGIPPWPEIVAHTEPIPELLRASVEAMNPDNVLETCRQWESAGVDQLVFSPNMLTREEALESIRLLGEHVIAKLDTDPVHRTDRFRQNAVAVG